MLFKDYTGSIVASLVMLVEGAAMALVAMTVTGETITLASFFTTWAKAFTINYLAALFIPASDWGAALCRKLKLEPGSVPFVLVNNIVVTAVYVTVVTAGMVLLAVGPAPVFGQVFIHLWPLLALAGYIVANIVTFIGVKFAVWIQSRSA